MSRGETGFHAISALGLPVSSVLLLLMCGHGQGLPVSILVFALAMRRWVGELTFRRVSPTYIIGSSKERSTCPGSHCVRVAVSVAGFFITGWVPDEQSPGVQVIFQNNKFARKYRARIEQFIISLTEHADKKDFSKSSLEISNKLAVPSCVDLNKALPPEKRTNQMWQTHGVIGCAQFHHGFMIDTRGWPLEADDPALCTNWEVPKYYQVFDEVYPSEPAANSSTLAKPAKPKETCFNCGGDHRLNDCKLARDMDRIRTNRREHQKKSGSNTNYSARYHKEPELHPTRQKFKPGKISDELREAMGLLPNQLPPYIYRMRLFGYPPGWLIEANRKASSLAMYDKDGRETDLRGESLEDGEVGEPSSDYGGTDTYDIQKIIEYPGFTVPVPLGFVDDSVINGMPPIQQHQLKKTLMEDTISKQHAAKKRSLEDEEAEKKKRIKTEVDMEVEDAEDVPQSQQPSESKAGQNDGRESPSMDKLQEQYLQLVQELGNESLESNGATTPSSNDSTKGVDNSVDVTPSANESVSDAEILRQTNFSFMSTTSISKDYGTPIMIKNNSFKVLPTPEKFSQGIEDHIPFENLPDSVGTFEKMRNIFRHIRDKVKGKKK
ncbi:hypothetical protein C0Q70_06758 [Pomacea canaliculata]|uniref:PSP proline-rich domain-containing protein n=1 Tax=Pomacea canaliculata TaxID=400727 RepID=A0A2T7PD44_POMCA|nr:hypothetical protein C0Q70_06758 [Pomacea canaliculata]